MTMRDNEVTQGIRSCLFEGTAQVRYKILSNETRSCFFIYTECATSREVKFQGYIPSRMGNFSKAKQISKEEFNQKAITA